MSKIKSFSVGNGDMFYIKHDSANFSIIDCCLPIDNEKAHEIIDEIMEITERKEITRFISTHPDQDHIQGLKELDEHIGILNFYCVENSATKDKVTADFERYCALRDDKRKAFYLHKGCTRKWMNKGSANRGASGINILWPDRDNVHFQDALQAAAAGENANDTSPIISYSLANGCRFLWMGDLENEFMEKIRDDVAFKKTNILFAPHHGRNSGRVPKKWLRAIDPDIIIIGEAPSADLNYYQEYDTITQNSAKDITFLCDSTAIDIYVESDAYSVDFLHDDDLGHTKDDYYLGTLHL